MGTPPLHQSIITGDIPTITGPIHLHHLQQGFQPSLQSEDPHKQPHWREAIQVSTSWLRKGFLSAQQHEASPQRLPLSWREPHARASTSSHDGLSLFRITKDYSTMRACGHRCMTTQRRKRDLETMKRGDLSNYRVGQLSRINHLSAPERARRISDRQGESIALGVADSRQRNTRKCRWKEFGRQVHRSSNAC